MQSLINKLFNGDAPAECEKLIDSTLYERQAKLDEAEKKETKLLDSLNEEQKKLFTEFQSAKDEVWCDEIDLSYERGFKTGARLMIEVHNIKF